LSFYSSTPEIAEVFESGDILLSETEEGFENEL